MRWDLDAADFNRKLQDEHKNLYQRAIESWGVEAQMNMAYEECAELIVALCHANRKQKQIDRKDIVGEVIDVSLMIEQLCHILDITPAEWFSEREEKLRRLRKLLNKEGK